MSPVVDDVPSPDEEGSGVALDLSPRTSADRSVSARRRWPWIIALVALVGAIGFVISRALTDATQFYVTADEAVARRDELAGRSFRIEGTVVEGSVQRTATGVDFRLTANGTEVQVGHRGDPPQLFQTCIPVVVEGRWHDATFASTAIIVAHDETYEAENSERMQQARAAGAESAACAQKAAVR